MAKKLPERRFAQDADSSLDRLSREYRTEPEPLPENLLDFLKKHGIFGRVSETMVYPIEPQIIGTTKTKFPMPIYREPYAEIDVTPEAGPLPRDIEHYCLEPNNGTGEWFYLICLFEAWQDLDLSQKLALIAARLNEKPLS